jgi:uncharacterized integral membrane protein
MNKGRLVGGIVCLALSALLLMLTFAQPGKVVFMIGDRNVPMVPVIVLAGIGGALMSSARKR